MFLSGAGAPSLIWITGHGCAVLHRQKPPPGLRIPSRGDAGARLMEAKMKKPKKKAKQDRPNNRKAKLKAKGRRRRVRAS